MQPPPTAVKKSAAKSDSPPRGRTMTRSASRGASPAVSVGKSRRSDPRDPLTFDPYEQLDADCQGAKCAALHPLSIWIVALFSLRQLRIKQPKATSVPQALNTTQACRIQ